MTISHTSIKSIMHTLFQISVDPVYFHLEFLQLLGGQIRQVVTATEQQPRVTALRMCHWPKRGESFKLFCVSGYQHGGFLEWGIRKSPWVSILKWSNDNDWMIWGYAWVPAF